MGFTPARTLSCKKLALTAAFICCLELSGITPRSGSPTKVAIKACVEVRRSMNEDLNFLII